MEKDQSIEAQIKYLNERVDSLYSTMERIPQIEEDSSRNRGNTCLAFIAIGLANLALLRSCTPPHESYAEQSRHPTAIESNVIGNRNPERFYEINGEWAYTNIDGKKVEDYCVGK